MADQEIICEVCQRRFMGEIGEDYLCAACREALDAITGKGTVNRG